MPYPKGQPFTPTRQRRRKRAAKKLQPRYPDNDRDRLVASVPKGKRFTPQKTDRPQGLGRRLQPRYGALSGSHKGSGGGRGGGGGTGRPSRAPGKPALSPEVQALLDLKYGGTERELASQKTAGAQQQVNSASYYDDYLKWLNIANQGVSQTFQNAQGQVAAQANVAAGQDTARMAQNQQEAQQSAAIRGTSAAPQVEQAGAIGARQALASSFGGYLGAQGGAAAVQGAGMLVSGAAAKVGALERGAARLREIDRLITETAAEKGMSAVDLKRQLQDEAIKRKATMDLLGLKTHTQLESEAATRRDDRRQARSDRASRRATRRDDRRMARQDRFDRQDKQLDNARADRTEARLQAGGTKGSGGSGGSGSSPFTPTQIRSGKAELRNYIARGKTGKDLPDSFDPLLARAAAQTIKNGGVTPALAKRIRREFGFTPRTKGKKKGSTVKQVGQQVEGIPRLF